MPGTPTDLARFARIGIRREHDLLLHLPLRYEDLTRVVPIGSNGARTIAWLQRNVARREQAALASKHPKQAAELDDFAAQLGRLGVTPETTYLYMHGHTLMDNVVMVLLETVCEKLRQMTAARITASKKEGVALKNEMSNYTNTQRSIRDVLLDNENYQDCPLFKRLYRDIERYMVRTIWRMNSRARFLPPKRFFRSSAAFGDGKRAFGHYQNAKELKRAA